MDHRATYLSTAGAFAGLIDVLPADGWDRPGLGTWSLRDLIGHAVSSGLREVPVVLGERAHRRDLESPEAYWSLIRSVAPEVLAAARAAATQDAGRSAAALGDRPASAVRRLVDGAAAALAGVGDDDLVRSPGGGMRVADWLPTRTFELVVHGQDIADAAGVAFAPPPAAVADAAAQAAGTAIATGRAPVLLRALTGRGSLPHDFTVL